MSAQQLVEAENARGRTAAIEGAEQSFTELELVNLRADVALEIRGLIGDMVEDIEARRIVVADIVECWTRLEPSVREAYENVRRPSGIAGLVDDYVEEVDRIWLAALDAEPFTPHDHVIDELGRLAWCIHIAQVQWRNILRKPPPSDWLAKLSSPGDRA
jgi:hypothetical protein